jgi:hypothetical protein
VSAGRLDAGHGRAAFVLLLIGLLAGGLVCLLVVNTTLATNALQIGGLAQANAASAQRLLQMRQEIAAEQSPAVMEREAAALGMRPDPGLTFVDLGALRISGAVAAAQGPSPALATGQLRARSGGRRLVHRRRA